MAESKEKKQNIWIDTDIEPIREFEIENFDKLLQYAGKNQKNIMRMLYNERSDELKLGCKFGKSKLHFFENAISKDQKLLTVFRLGALYGNIECLDTIEYEGMQDSLALSRFQMVTNSLPKLKNEIQELIKYLYNKVETKEQELLNEVNENSLDLMLMIRTLSTNGLIYESERCGYLLTDTGRRAAKQLSNK